jgi:polysaccharide chain length determinant protein (PEP-CTERM system associated)
VLPGKKYTPEDILKILWYRKWFVIVPFMVACASTYVVARRLPEIYRSETLIQVVPQRIPESYVRSTVTTRIEDRLGGIQQIILSRSRLERIINDFDLYPAERQVMVMEDVVAVMRDRDVKVRVERGDAFRVSYNSGNPRTAQRVAERLGSLFIDENLRDREALADQTSQFLEGQLEEAKRRLLDHEKKLEQYRERYSGELPTQQQGNQQAIQNAQMQLQSISETMNRDRERRLLLERQLADIEASEFVSVPAPVTTSSNEPAVGTTTAEQLEQANAQRQAMLVRLKPDHPDVLAIGRRIRELTIKLQAETPTRPAAAGAEQPKPISPSEILRRNRLRDVKANLDAVDRDLAANKANEDRLRGLIVSYQARVDAAPARESELVELTRDYSTLQGIYTSLLGKREESKLAANVERQQIGEQFKILDPARIPERPFSPNRLRLMALGAAMGLGLGVLMIGLLEYRDTTFKTEDDVLRVLQIPVLALVPIMASEKEVRRRRRRKLLVAVGAVATVISSVAVVLLWKLQGS